MKRALTTLGFVTLIGVLTLLMVGGGAAVAIGLLYSVWTGDILGWQVAATGAVAIAVGLVLVTVLDGL